MPRPGDWARFYDKVATSGGCWEWTAGCFSQGYGAFSLEGEARRAHRVLYVWTHGEVPDGMVLHHVCENKKCVRPHPDHVWPRTPKENVLLGDGPTAANARKTKSVSGGDLDYVDPRGWRGSRADRAAAVARHREKNREKINAERRAARVHVVHDERPCQHCGLPFTPQRSTGRFCDRRECVLDRQRQARRDRSRE